jgi:hypothetical protein
MRLLPTSVAVLVLVGGQCSQAAAGPVPAQSAKLATRYPIDDAPPEAPRETNPLVLYSVLGATLALATLVGLLSLYKQVKSRAPATRTGLFYCPQCRRKIRYPLTFAGRKSMCPRCRTKFVFPLAETSKR